jgi:hypothetical protein
MARLWALVLLLLAPFIPVPATGIDATESTPCATQDSAFTSRFALGGPGWIGGDGAQSVRIGKRTLWLFGDSFIGHVESDGSHNHPGCRLVRNAALVSTEEGPRLAHDGGSLMPTDDEQERWNWPGDGVYEAGEVRLAVYDVRTKPGPVGWDFEITGVRVARLSWPELELIDMTARPYRGILWGMSLYQDRAWTYIYGWGQPDRLYVARARAGALHSRWFYKTSRGPWSRRASSAGPILKNVTTASVIRYRGRYVLVSQRPYLSEAIALYQGISPYGPFDRGRTIYRTPETSGLAFTYLATAHRLIDDELLIGYSGNSGNWDDLHRYASLYRPRFVRADLGCLIGSA